MFLIMRQQWLSTIGSNALTSYKDINMYVRFKDHNEGKLLSVYVCGR